MLSSSYSSSNISKHSACSIELEVFNSNKTKCDDNTGDKTSSAALTRTAPAEREGKHEENTLGWLSNNNYSDNNNSNSWLQNPGIILLLTSIPFCTGAYIGHKIPTDSVEDFVLGSAMGIDKKKRDKITSERSRYCSVKKIKIADQDAVKAIARRTALKALRIATLGTVGTFGFIGALGFYMNGFDSIEYAVSDTKRWASSWNASLKSLLGGDKAARETHPKVLATKHMDEHEELQYVYEKYIKENDEDDLVTSHQFSNREKNEEDLAPTLFLMYQKYFSEKDHE